jgi:hypothetical protein
MLWYFGYAHLCNSIYDLRCFWISGLMTIFTCVIGTCGSWEARDQWWPHAAVSVDACSQLDSEVPNAGRRVAGGCGRRGTSWVYICRRLACYPAWLIMSLADVVIPCMQNSRFSTAISSSILREQCEFALPALYHARRPPHQCGRVSCLFCVCANLDTASSCIVFIGKFYFLPCFTCLLYILPFFTWNFLFCRILLWHSMNCPPEQITLLPAVDLDGVEFPWWRRRRWWQQSSRLPEVETVVAAGSWGARGYLPVMLDTTCSWLISSITSTSICFGIAVHRTTIRWMKADC